MGEMRTTAEDRPYWETTDYESSNRIVRANMRIGCRSVIATGYYLKRIRDNRFYRDGGYKNFGEYAKAECGMTEDVASRTIKKMEVFSEGGNSPIMAKKWEDFSTSKLQEILYLTDEQAESVTPDMTVKEIREIRRPESLPEPEEVVVMAVELPAEPEEMPPAPLVVEGNIEDLLPDAPEPAGPEEAGPARCVTGQSKSGFCGAAAYCAELVSCCADCSEDCNIRCGWLTKKEEPLATSQEPLAEQYYAGKISKEELWNGQATRKLATSQEPEIEKDASWFVKRYAEGYGKELIPGLMRICQKAMPKSEKVKEIKNLISPHGGYGGGGLEFGFNFGRYSQGVSFDADDYAVECQMTYNQFVDVLMQLYDPLDLKWNEALATSQEPEKQEPMEEVVPESAEEGTPLEVLVFSDCRTRKTLMQAGVETVEQLQGMDDSGFMKIRGMSRQQREDIRASLKKWTESGSEPAESESNLQEAEQEISEPKKEFPPYNEKMLEAMIDDAEERMAYYQKTGDRYFFTEWAMRAESYRLLSEKHKTEKEGKKITVCCSARDCLHCTPDGYCSCEVLWLNDDGSCEDIKTCEDEREEKEE